MASFHVSGLPRAALAVAALLTSSTMALAGPPLICHPFDIGTARSLPFGDATRNWAATDPSYKPAALIDDTLALLTPDTPVIVRMETLRRAAIYASKDVELAGRLMTAVRSRSTKSAKTAAEALPLFDTGYLVETFRQLSSHTPAMSSVSGDVDGYALVTHAIELRSDDPSMQFAAALIASGSKATASRMAAHLEKARMSAAGNPLLARNLGTHFGAS